MNKKDFIYRLYGRSRLRSKKNLDYNKSKLYIEKFSSHNLKTNANNILDIGSGYGENAIFLANKSKESKIIACDNFFDGNLKIAKLIKEQDLKNLYIFNGNVHEFLDNLEEKSYFNSVWILFPDPWPKKKHFKRRLINKSFFNKISKFLKKTADLNIVTDSKSYLKEILFLTFQIKKHYIWENQNKFDWDYINSAQVETKYFKKAIKNGANPFFIKLRKL
tara:strand:- start:974 stop:1633 length:660 start_codon:yes stop_codon:yes gene_type:complete